MEDRIECTMNHRRKTYNKVYTTQEFEDLICEYDIQCRMPALSASECQPFFCIYCGLVCTNKKDLKILQRLGCPQHKEHLKMYLVLQKGAGAAVEEVLLKSGFVNAPNPKRKQSTRRKEEDRGSDLSKDDKIDDF